MDPSETLRDNERLLARRFGVSHPPHVLSGEDLDCSDPRDASHWVRVYTELVDFMHGLLDCPPSEPTGDPAPTRAETPLSRRAMALQVRILELHLAFWTDRLHRLAGDS